MDRSPAENHIDPIERETSTTGENDTGDSGDEAARIEARKRREGKEPPRAHQPLQTKATPRP